MTDGSDVIIGNAGGDFIFALGGNDVLKGGGGADHLDGGTGTDTATYEDSTTGVQVDLKIGKGSWGTAEGDTLASVENLFGSNYNDWLIGDGKDKRTTADRSAAGIVLAGTSDIAINGNTFSGLSTKALTLEGDASKRVLFSNNVLTETKSDHSQLEKAAVSGNLD